MTSASKPTSVRVDMCQKPAYGPSGWGSATMAAEHVWRFHGYAPQDEGGKEIWYCERCRKLEKRWPSGL